ncbi:MAG: helix-turn-helix domain-containing protein [Pseudomonadota bacterium]
METQSATGALSALAHDRRLSLFRTLVQAGPEGMAAGDVASANAVAFTTASAQLAILARAGLITSERQGRSIIYAANYAGIRSLIAFLMEDCCGGRADILEPLAAFATTCCSQSQGHST